MQSQWAHAVATRAVITRGSLITAYLADRATELERTEHGKEWGSFAQLIGSLYMVEDGLQYVSVSRNGVILYHKQTSGLDAGAPPAFPRQPRHDPDSIRLLRKRLRVGTNDLPIVAFAAPIADEAEGGTMIEVGFRRDTVGREEETASAAIGTMFKLSLATVLVSFATCALLVVWIMRRETSREQQRREEEHLAFAGVLANGIVHDFRNPMSSMRLDVQMMGKEIAKGAACRHERVARLAGRIAHTIDRLDKTFREFLFLSKPSESAREPLDIVPLLRDCIEMIAPRLEHSRVKVSLTSTETALRVMGFGASLRRAFINVLTNAEQFSPPDGTVSVEVGRADGFVAIDVKDGGPGIPPAQRRTLFEMFSTSRPGGTGLGLFLARTAIENSGGSIRVVDKADKAQSGAWFRILLPAAAD
jgi:signal transduction histidine kinase